jgi:hypothetical protein
MAKKQAELRDVVGSRGEKILELCLTDYEQFQMPLFRPGFLGDKWPAIDFYVELRGSRKRNFFFFAQAKSTQRPLPATATHVRISSKKRDVHRLIKTPGPTYMFAIHEPSKRVFVQCIHSKTPRRAITSIPVANELTPTRLRDLHDEVSLFWKAKAFKPAMSSFL